MIENTTRPRGLLKDVSGYRPPLLLVLFGVGLIVAIGSQLILDPEPASLQAMKVGVPLILVLPVFYTALHVHGSERGPERQSWILFMSIVFGIIGAGTVYLVDVIQLADGSGFHEFLFPLLMGATAGIGVGCVAGLAYDNLLASQAKLKAEVKETRRLNQHLAVINRVLRHNVRNHLTVAFGKIDGVLAKIDNRDVAEDIRRCRESLTTLHSSTEKALEINQLTDSDAESVPIDLGPVIETQIERVRQESSPTLHVDVDDDIRVVAHPLLPTAISEAVDNALTHNPHSGLTITLTAKRLHDLVLVQIRDDGTGIRDSEREPLERESEEPLHHTSGVGLWIIKWVTEMSGGTYRIHQNREGGTTVEIRLPRSESE